MRPSSVAVGSSFAKIVSPTISQHTSNKHKQASDKLQIFDTRTPAALRAPTSSCRPFGFWPGLTSACIPFGRSGGVTQTRINCWNAGTTLRAEQGPPAGRAEDKNPRGGVGQKSA